MATPPGMRAWPSPGRSSVRSRSKPVMEIGRGTCTRSRRRRSTCSKRRCGRRGSDHMADYQQIERRITQALGLTRRPVAVTFRDAAPPGVPKFEGTAPSGCTFWRLAVTGAPFYTVPADHFNCPIGSHTHNIPLPVAREAELGQTLTFMTGIGYLRMEEVPGIPRLPRTPGAIVYAALGETPVDPDVVLFLGQ